MPRMIDPVCGMTGVMERYGHWFCSDRCAQVFAHRADRASPRATAAACRTSGRHALLDPWVWVPLSGLTLATAGGWWPSAAHVSEVYAGYLRRVLVPFLTGLLIGGWIDYFVPKSYVVKLLSGPRKRVIARATLLGFLASSCSHGCLALTIELFRKGASTPAVVSFLLASPWASMSLTFILLGLFGARGLVLIGGALGIAAVTGLIFQRLDRRGLIDKNPQTVELEEGFSIWQDLRTRWRGYSWTPAHVWSDARGVVAGTVPLGRAVLGWVQLGLVFSALFGGLVPDAFTHRFLGPSLLGLALTMGFAAVIEVCSEGTAPLAFELYRHTGAFGNAFAFLMGGVVTDYTELGALWTNIGRRTVLWLLVVTLPLVAVMGAVLNGL